MDTTTTVAVGVAVAVLGSGLVFYLNALLQRRSDYHALREKLETVAGKHATVRWGGTSFKIDSFDRRGLILRSRKQTVFIPTQSVLQQPFIVPSDDYETVVAQEEREAQEKALSRMRGMMDEVVDDWLPRIVDKMKDEILDDGGEMNAVIGLRIRKALKEEGFDLARPAGSTSSLPLRSAHDRAKRDRADKDGGAS